MVAQVNLKVEKVKLQPMTKLERKLLTELRGLGVGKTARVLVAVSGGADSVALLAALARLQSRQGIPAQLFVAHLNHQLRGAESDGDETFVRELAARFELAALSERIDVAAAAAMTGQNLEATARRLRYDFLRRAAEACGAGYVFTAHTLDDQAETVLLRLLRGSGAEGLRAIHQRMALSEQVQLLRPLLTVTRAEVLEHCAAYQLSFRTDGSNLSLEFTRNRVRHELLPLLRTFNPRCAEILARTAKLLTEDEEYLKGAMSKALSQATGEDTRLGVSFLRTLAPAIQRRVLRAWVQTESQFDLQLEVAHSTALEKLLEQGQSGRRVDLPGGWQVAREFDWLRLLKADEARQMESAPVILQAETAVRFGAYEFFLRRNLSHREATQALAKWPPGWAALLREGTALATLQLRTRQPGDAYVPQGRQRAVKLKNLLMRGKIPQTERAAYPLMVTAAGQIVWAPGLPVASAFAPQVEQGCALVTVRKA